MNDSNVFHILSPQSIQQTLTIMAAQQCRSSPSLTSWMIHTRPPPWTRGGTLDLVASHSHWIAVTVALPFHPATATRTWTTSWVPMGFLFPAPSAPTNTPPSATTPLNTPAALTTYREATRDSACVSAWLCHRMQSRPALRQCQTSPSLKRDQQGRTHAAMMGAAWWRAITGAVRR